MVKDRQLERIKLLEKRSSMTGPRQKNKKEREWPTFSNDQFLYPMVVGGIVYVYEIMVWFQYDTYLSILHQHDIIPYIYEYNWWTVVIPGLIFLFSLLTYLGATDILMSKLSELKKHASDILSKHL